MNKSFDVRVLGAEDTALMRAMLSMFGKAFVEAATYTAQQPDDAYLEHLLSSSTFVAVAALSGDEVIGGIAAYVLRKFEQARSELYIYDLAVDEAHRRQGVATAMNLVSNETNRVSHHLRIVRRDQRCRVVHLRAAHGFRTDVRVLSICQPRGLQ